VFDGFQALRLAVYAKGAIRGDAKSVASSR